MVNKCSNCGHNEEEHFSSETAMADGRRPCVHIDKTPNGRTICGCKNFTTDEDRFKKAVVEAIEEVHPELIGYSVPYDAADLAWRKFIGADE